MQVSKDLYNGSAFIYALVDPRDQQVRYIGKTIHVNKRLKQHLKDKCKSYKTHWIKNLSANDLLPLFVLLDEVEHNSWDFWERHYISLYRSWGFNLTNANFGGDGVMQYMRHTPEAKLKIGAAGKGRVKSPETIAKIVETRRKNGGYNVSEETKDRLRSIGLGRKHSKETKGKMSKSHIGKIKSPETRAKLSLANKGQVPWIKGLTHSEETKKKLSASKMGNKVWLGRKHTKSTCDKISDLKKGNKYFLGKNHSEETKKKLSASKLGSKNPMFGKTASHETREKLRIKSLEMWAKRRELNNNQTKQN